MNKTSSWVFLAVMFKKLKWSIDQTVRKQLSSSLILPESGTGGRWNTREGAQVQIPFRPGAKINKKKNQWSSEVGVKQVNHVISKQPYLKFENE